MLLTDHVDHNVFSEFVSHDCAAVLPRGQRLSLTEDEILEVDLPIRP
jgi:hypothetical protein